MLPAFTRPTLAPQTSATLSSSTGYETAFESRRASSTAGFTPTSVGAASTAPGAGENGRKKVLPWEGKEARYVIGSGELGLLNELQMPRRGAIVPLDRDFLRLPRHLFASTDDFGNLESPRPAAEPLVPLNDDVRLREPGRRFSPILPSALNSAASERDSRSSGTVSTPDDWPPQPPLQRPPYRPPPARAAALHPEEDTLVGSADVRAQMKLPEGDGSDSVRADLGAGERTRGGRGRRGKATLFQEDMRGHSTVRNADASPPVRTGSVFDAELLAGAARKVETASAAERIAAFRPGTRFRVAVDKGLTGLGITVKEIRGRFFVYKLQTLADGSPGAAEVRTIYTFDTFCGGSLVV